MLYILPPAVSPQHNTSWYNTIWIQPNNKDSGAGGSLEDEETAKNGRSLSECYFGGGREERVPSPPPAAPAPPPSPDIQHHLQSMFHLLRPDETIKMAVKLESVHSGRTRYLAVVSKEGRQMTEESCLLGIDCNHFTTVGLVLKVLADTYITLDGDGGFSVRVCGKQHIFKPVSVQAMWSALQTLHKVSAKAREHNYFLGGLTHDWVAHYEGSISSDRSCLNEWHAMDSLESRRPPSPDSIRHKPGEKDETETVIRSALKEIMMSVDLDEVTSKQVRTKLEEALDMDLAEYKSFIDQEMLVILGQMDQATEIFSHVYLGSEWNASNLEELHKNGVCHILNVTREIDNFFPGMFDYLNIRVYDDEKTDLLKHWDDTFKYITKAKAEGSKVLVHCKMGVSRSASVVIAYAMKAYSWDLKKALSYVQNKRNCIKPNSNFISQLETYEGILDANKNKEKLQRSKSETNLKRNMSRGKGSSKERSSIGEERKGGEKETRSERENGRGSAGNLATVTPPLIPSSTLPPTTPCERLPPLHTPLSSRPKSWSPDHHTANHIFTHTQGGVSVSIERLPECVDGNGPPPPPPLPPSPPHHNINVRLPCANGLAYSVSQNKAMQLSSCNSQENGLTSNSLVKHKVSAFESEAGQGRKKSVPNVTGDSLEKRSKPEQPPQPLTEQQPSTEMQPPSNNQEVKSSSSVERAGLVKHLRREFEARGGGSGGGGENGGGVGSGGEETQSLPSSPVSEREELSVRRLVGRYERPHPPPPLHPHHPPLHHHHHHHHHHPPPPPQRRKQEQGRTHPLTRLSILHKTRHTNPVYNTM